MYNKKKWTIEKTKELFDKPLLDLIFLAQNIHRKNFNHNKIQISTLLSIKTGLCPEDCKYCPQSSRYKTGIKTESLIKIDKILQAANKAKKNGSTRFCMGAAWKNPKDNDMIYLKEIIKKVKKLGLETCMTLGSLNKKQSKILYDAGLDYYNHNIDTSKEFYKKIITTRSYQERLDTLNNVRETGIKICSGGIIGLGENIKDRISLLMQLANMKNPPESVPINMLVKVSGTPLEKNKDIDPFEFIRIIAIARIMMPSSYIRLSAGRENMNEQTQAMCFMSGANSIFYGCKLLTTPNPEEDKDLKLLKKLGLKIESKKINNNILKKKKLSFKKNNVKFYDATIN
ncbi:biotin synthase BioB [Enterobacterales bacterium endosymbiont of Anomoneura mori]|uniref:biotin synthase BioB n=1 Tax=Enterobacterales bacterium endosymbiont of Anomoneura mori TaxID=3132096 RepID=UPI00399CC920